MNIGDLCGKAKGWLETVKALPYDGGPSTAKWVYLRVAEIAALGFLVLIAVTAFMYVRTGRVDEHMAWLIVGVLGPLFGFAANTKNQQQNLNAQLASGAVPTNTSSTPVSAESEAKQG